MEPKIVLRETVAKVLLFNENSEVLVMRLGVHKLKPASSHRADLPGGLVDLGESEREAAVRETAEEAGISLEASELRLVYANTKLYAAEQKSVTRLLYAVQLAHTPQITLSWEHKSYVWGDIRLLLDEARGLTSAYREAVLYIKENGITE